MNARDLDMEIRVFVSERGPSTCSEIASGIRARYIDVLDRLQAGAFLVASTPEHGSARATYWTAAPVPSQPLPQTDTDWLAHALADGRWHSLDDLLARSQRERGHGLTVHSRAATLRKRGHTVEQRSERAGRRVRSFYRLVSLNEAVVPNPGEARLGSAAECAAASIRDGATALVERDQQAEVPSPLGVPVSLSFFGEAA